jgi:outer membrane protein W
MMKKIASILFLLALTLQGYSQIWSRYKYEGYYGLGFTNFMGDIPAPTKDHPTGNFLWVNLFNTIGYTANAGLRYNFKEKQFLNGSIFIGQLYGKDPAENPKYWDRGIQFRSTFMEFTGKYEYQIIKEKKKSTVYRKLGESALKNISIPTYIFMGAGGILSVGKSTTIINEGKNTVSENYIKFAPVIPFGVGFKYRLNRLTYLNMEVSTRIAIGDKLDNAAGKENSSFGSWIDQYQSITFKISHKLRQNQNVTPKFRRK